MSFHYPFLLLASEFYRFAEGTVATPFFCNLQISNHTEGFNSFRRPVDSVSAWHICTCEEYYDGTSC